MWLQTVNAQPAAFTGAGSDGLHIFDRLGEGANDPVRTVGNRENRPSENVARMPHRRLLCGGHLDDHIIPVVFRASSRLLLIDVIESIAGSDATSAAKIARLGFPDTICSSTSSTTSIAEPR